jgi:ferredoxin-NADP reductase
MGQPHLPALLVAHHRPGFYMRVLSEGHVGAGDEIVRTARGRHELSVADVDALLYLPDPDRERVALAVDVPALSPGWQGSFRALLDTDPGSGTRSPGGVPTGPPPAWAGFRTLDVDRVVRESATVSSYFLTSPDGAGLPPARPGQYLTLRVPGAGDPVPVRTYSLSGGSDERSYRISVKRDALGLVSGYLLDRLARGDRIEVAAPRGDFVLDPGTTPVLLVSAGIGVTPVLALLHELAATASPREVWWIHTTHDASTHVFADEVADLVTSLPTARSIVYYTAGSAPLPPGVVAGRLTAAAVTALELPVDASAYICGPEAFMDDVTSALTDAGLAASRIHTERFGSRSAINPGVVAADRPPAHQPPGAAGTGVEVSFARTGLTTRWSDDYASLLELAEACDVPTQWSCRTGVCHTCATAVLSGGTTYTTTPLEPPGADEVLICSARPSEDLVLDL